MCTCSPLNRRGLLGLLPGVAALALVGVGTAGCGGGGGPAPVRWGRENCDYCGMIIDDPHFAGEVRGGMPLVSPAAAAVVGTASFGVCAGAHTPSAAIHNPVFNTVEMRIHVKYS